VRNHPICGYVSLTATADAAFLASTGTHSGRTLVAIREEERFMDPISTALTAAWLDAVRRTQSEYVQRLEEVMPQSKPSRAERTLTDVIASGLESGGAEPLSEHEPGPAAPERLLDVRV
jgi:hypothetical protein